VFRCYCQYRSDLIKLGESEWLSGLVSDLKEVHRILDSGLCRFVSVQLVKFTNSGQHP
jgi:hypothetical protein